MFAISGGASLHLIDSIARHPEVTYVCPQHEQAGAMAADAYARVTRHLGAALSTSGPGATNMITGVCCAYYDSVPVIYITGQVASFRLKRDTGSRQVGFQETDVVAMFRPITKYAVLVEDPMRIRYELEKACYLAQAGRPGPVVIDLPDDVQRVEIRPEELESFRAEPEAREAGVPAQQLEACVTLLQRARRPVLILGWGVRLGKADDEAKALVERLGVPVVPTWAMRDFLPSDHPLMVGAFGTHGTRYGNFAVQNADLIVTIGARLDTHEAGSPLSSFAREAKKIIVDIDAAELEKFPRFGMPVDVPIRAHARAFLLAALERLRQGFAPQDLTSWKQRIADWKARYPICPPSYEEEPDVNPYVFVKILAQESAEGDTFFLDTGCAVAWMMQAFEFKRGQRCFHAFNNTPMGYGLPASIGASIALGRKPVTLITGDGSLQMNIQELATVIQHRLPIKIVLINNHGYSMIQQTQDQWFEGRHEASSVPSGLAFPDWVKVAEAYGFKTVTIDRRDHLRERLREALRSRDAVFCNVEIHPSRRVIPQVKFGRPIEDAEPLLDREEFFRNMIVTPMEVSKTPMMAPPVTIASSLGVGS